MRRYCQSKSRRDRNSETDSVSPCRARVCRYSSTVRGGYFNLARTVRAAGDGVRRQGDKLSNELVRVLGDEIVGLQAGLRKVLEIERNDHIRTAFDCGREDVPVVRVWKG